MERRSPQPTPVAWLLARESRPTYRLPLKRLALFFLYPQFIGGRRKRGDLNRTVLTAIAPFVRYNRSTLTLKNTVMSQTASGVRWTIQDVAALPDNEWIHSHVALLVLSIIYSQRILRELFYNLTDFSNTLSRTLVPKTNLPARLVSMASAISWGSSETQTVII